MVSGDLLKNSLFCFLRCASGTSSFLLVAVMHSQLTILLPEYAIKHSTCLYYKRTPLEKYYIKYFPKIANELSSSPEEETADISQVSILEKLQLRSWVQIPPDPISLHRVTIALIEPILGFCQTKATTNQD
jgi:hypothetical protein